METKLVRIAEISATSKHPIFTSVYHLINEDTISKQSVVFRERRLMDLVITKSIFLLYNLRLVAGALAFYQAWCR